MKKIWIIGFLFISGQLLSQDRIPAEISNTQININILEPSLSLEKRLSDKMSVTFTGGLTTLTGEDDFEDLKISLNPVARVLFRNYYPRKKVKKQLKPNSGNYIGLMAGYNFGSIADNIEFGKISSEEAFYMGPVWGIQRNYQSGIHLALNLGAGFITGKNTDIDFNGILSFELGFVLSSN